MLQTAFRRHAPRALRKCFSTTPTGASQTSCPFASDPSQKVQPSQTAAPTPASSSASTTKQTSTSSASPAKPFSAMPTVTSWQTLVDGITGNFNVKKPIGAWTRRFQELGDIYKMDMFGKPLVLLADVTEYEKILRACVAKYPPPLNLPPLLKYSKDKEKEQPGWIPFYHLSQGEHWRKSRTILDEKLLHPTEVDQYIPVVGDIAEEMIRALQKRLTPEGKMTGLDDLVYFYSVEQIGYVVFGFRLGGLATEPSQEIKDLLADLRIVLQMTAKLTFELPFWNLFPTPSYKKLIKAVEKPYGEMLAKNADAYYAAHPDIERHDLLHHQRMRGLSEQEAIQNANVQFQAGSDSTTHSIQWLLYNLGRFPQVQEKLRESVRAVLSKGEKLDSQKMKELKYLKAVVRESLRLTPTATGLVRTLQQPATVSGYEVPAGTDIILMQIITNKRPDVFERPDELWPERWMQTGDSRVSAFSAMPFGFGPRMCQGFRVAELEMYCLLAHLVNNFSWEFQGPPAEPYCELFFRPEKPLNLKWKQL